MAVIDLIDANPSRHSVTSASAYERCPLSWHHRYRMKTPRPRTPKDTTFKMGTAGHAALEEAYRWQRVERRSHELDVDRALTALRWAWDDQQLPHDSSLDRYISYVQGVVDAVGDVDHRSIIGTEHRVEFDTPAGHRIGGAADLVLRTGDRSLLIRDWKFGQATMGAADLAWDFQGCVYGYAIRQTHPWADVIYFEHYRPTVPSSTVVELTDQAITTAMFRLDALIDTALADSEPRPREGRWCDWCPFQHLCPAKGGKAQGLLDLAQRR